MLSANLAGKVHVSHLVDVKMGHLLLQVQRRLLKRKLALQEADHYSSRTALMFVCSCMAFSLSHCRYVKRFLGWM